MNILKKTGSSDNGSSNNKNQNNRSFNNRNPNNRSSNNENSNNENSNAVNPNNANSYNVNSKSARKYVRPKSEIEKLREVIEEADAILIGAGSGLSTSAGFTYSGERFHKYFYDFEAKYGIRDMYSLGFYHFDTLEEYWGYWSRYIYINRYMDAPKPVYEKLYELVKDKDYFVLTTNVDHCFQKAGFDKHRLFYTQGDYGLWQCGKPCHNKTYDNEETVMEMVKTQKDGKIPTELIPYCSICGAPMTMNLRADDTFVEDEGWHKAALRYDDFRRRHQGLKMVYLELGVGYNTPGIIKYPFWQMTMENPKAMYVCMNAGDAVGPREIENRSIYLDGDIGMMLNAIMNKA